MGECDVVLALQRQYYETFANARSSDNMHHVINQSATLRRIPVVMVLEEKNSPASSSSSLVTLERSFVQMKTKGRRGISSGGVGTVFPQFVHWPLSSLSEFGYLSGEEGWYSSSDYLMQECGGAMARRLRLKEAMQRGDWVVLSGCIPGSRELNVLSDWLTKMEVSFIGWSFQQQHPPPQQ